MPVELDAAALAADRFGAEVGEDEAWVPAVGKADVPRRQHGQGQVAVAADELVRLRVAVRQGRLHKGTCEEAHLAGRVGVLLVEEQGLSDEAGATARWPTDAG
ncbi:MAG TPA: hypothetical protein VNJ70_12055 [Thermoanaerobaculia bacterium]|nr:hypothetical protein [Thermoanaerobaculia bacterium]